MGQSECATSVDYNKKNEEEEEEEEKYNQNKATELKKVYKLNQWYNSIKKQCRY